MAKAAYPTIALILVVLAVAGWLWASKPSSIQVATEWGLPGVWQRECASPVGPDNPRYAYVVADGKILLQRDFGRELKDTSEITDVERTSAGDIQYMVHFVQLGPSRAGQATRQNIFTKSSDGRIRAVVNKLAGTGEESVAGGVRADDNSPTPWMSRCEPR